MAKERELLPVPLKGLMTKSRVVPKLRRGVLQRGGVRAQGLENDLVVGQECGRGVLQRVTVLAHGGEDDLPVSLELGGCMPQRAGALPEGRQHQLAVRRRVPHEANVLLHGFEHVIAVGDDGLQTLRGCLSERRGAALGECHQGGQRPHRGRSVPMPHARAQSSDKLPLQDLAVPRAREAELAKVARQDRERLGDQHHDSAILHRVKRAGHLSLAIFLVRYRITVGENQTNSSSLELA
mmetsp:Transcript_37112/g.115487  ORF Transcript_37112/g.115487 Transcript_37112/m.115487 type:complete len:238 (-) Transcript_37112:3-716(-)